jgi:hypothetical protein
MRRSLVVVRRRLECNPRFAESPAKQCHPRQTACGAVQRCRYRNAVFRNPRKARTGIDRERLSGIVPRDCQAHAAAVQRLPAHHHGSLDIRAPFVEAKLHEIALGSSAEARRRRSPGGSGSEGGADLSASYQKIVFVSVPRQVDARIRRRVIYSLVIRNATLRPRGRSLTNR